MDYRLCWSELTCSPPDTGYNVHAFNCLALVPACCSLSTFLCVAQKSLVIQRQFVTRLHLKHALAVCLLFFFKKYNHFSCYKQGHKNSKSYFKSHLNKAE